MKKLLLILLCLPLFYSCGEKNKETNEETKKDKKAEQIESTLNIQGIQLIPKNTVGVAIIDLAEIYDKADIDEIRELELVQDAIKVLENNLDDKIIDIINDPNECGIDIKSEFYIFSSVYMNRQFVCASIGMNDIDKFEEIIDDYAEEILAEIEGNKNEYYKYVAIGDVAYAWDKEVLLMIAQANNESVYDRYNMYDSDLKKVMTREIERLMTLDSDEKITSNSNFKDFYSIKTDACLWISTDFAEDIMPEELLSMGLKQVNNELKARKINSELSSDDIYNNSAALFLNFGKGNVSYKTGIYINDNLQDLAQNILGIHPKEFSVELIFTFDDSGKNSLNLILISQYQEM